jgi:hypothetical protein
MWDKYHTKEPKFTRGHLVELLYSDNIIISNVTFVDSPYSTQPIARMALNSESLKSLFVCSSGGF